MPFVHPVSKDYAVSDIPEALRKQANQVVRSEIKQFTISNKQSGVLKHRRVVTIFSAQSPATELILAYDQHTRIRKIKASIYDASGKLVRKLSANEIRDYAALDGISIYNDARIKVLNLSHTRLPYTVAYEYEVVLGGIRYAMFPNWAIQTYHESVEEARFEVIVPNDQHFQYRTLNLDLEPDVQSEGSGKTKYVWQVEHLPAIVEEPYGPNAMEVLPAVVTSPDVFKIDSYQGSMASWKDFGLFILQLLDGRSELPPHIRDDVQHLVEGAPDVATKIERIYQYLQANTRYVSVQIGIGGWQPFDATYVANNKYGDCKALSNFMMALLQVAGIESWPALIQRGSGESRLIPDFTSPRFNHMVLYVPETDTWLECTSSDYPAGYLGADNANRFSLLITPKGGELVRTPALTAQDSRRTSTSTFVLLNDGTVGAEYRAQYYGQQHELLRYLKANFNEQDQRKWVNNQFPLMAQGLNEFQLQVESQNPAANMQLTASIKHLGAVTGKRWFIPINPLNAFTAIPPELKTRTLPVYFHDSYLEEDEIEFKLPAGYVLEDYPRQPLEVSSDVGVYRLHLEANDQKLLVRRSLEIAPSNMSAESYPAFRHFFQQVASFDATQLVLVQTP